MLNIYKIYSEIQSVSKENRKFKNLKNIFGALCMMQVNKKAMKKKI